MTQERERQDDPTPGPIAGVPDRDEQRGGFREPQQGEPRRPGEEIRPGQTPPPPAI